MTDITVMPTQCCDDCDVPLTDDVHILILTRGEEEKTICNACWEENEDQYRMDDWTCDEDEWCEEHEQVMWKNGVKCGGCCDEEYIGDDVFAELSKMYGSTDINIIKMKMTEDITKIRKEMKASAQ